MTKKIMIDARVVQQNYDHGIACYTYELIKNLFLISDSEKNTFQYIILVNKNSCLLELQIPKNCQFVFLKNTWSRLLGQFELLKVIYKHKPQLFHSPSFIVPLLSRVKLIATIHDMNHIALSKNYSWTQKLYYALLAIKFRKKNLILTVSDFSKIEIIKYMNVSADRIKVIYNGVSSVFCPQKFDSEIEKNDLRHKYLLPENFIFAMGNNKPHKNLRQLINVYCKNTFPIPLVILCQNHEELKQHVELNNKIYDIIFINHVNSQEDLAKIYSLCTFFIFPSIYEGWSKSINNQRHIHARNNESKCHILQPR